MNTVVRTLGGIFMSLAFWWVALGSSTHHVLVTACSVSSPLTSFPLLPELVLTSRLLSVPWLHLFKSVPAGLPCSCCPSLPAQTWHKPCIPPPARPHSLFHVATFSSAETPPQPHTVPQLYPKCRPSIANKDETTKRGTASSLAPPQIEEEDGWE